MTTPESDPGLSSGRRTLLTIIIGGLSAAALVSAGFILFGDQGDIVARTLWTVLILTAFALIVLAETRAQYNAGWILPLRVGGWVLSAFVALFNTWDFRTSLSDTIVLVPMTITAIIVIQLAVLHITLVGRAFWTDPSAPIRIAAFVATAAVAVVAIMIVLPLLLRPDDGFGELYWRFVAALAIVAAVATVISPLVRAMTRPRTPVAPPAAAAYGPGPGQQYGQPFGAAQPYAGQPYTSGQQYGAVPPAPPAQMPAPMPPATAQAPAPAWPVYYGTNVPLPVMPDGSPDWQAYQTGQPTPGSRPYPA